MATYNFLDKTGLGLVWAKIKSLIPTKAEDIGAVPAYLEDDGVGTVVMNVNDPDLEGQRVVIAAEDVENDSWNASVAVSEDGVLIQGSQKEVSIISQATDTQTMGVDWLSNVWLGEGTVGIGASDTVYIEADNDIHIGSGSDVYIYGVVTPETDDMAANKEYVDNAIASSGLEYIIYMSGNQIILSDTNLNPSHMSAVTLPVYDGTVVSGGGS